MKLPMISDEEIEKLCVKYLAWDEPVSDRDLNLVKLLFEAQRDDDQELKDQEMQEMIEEIERASHPMNTNMYGISLGKVWWQAFKKEMLGGLTE